MKNSITSKIDTNYRKLYGKLFSSLFKQFGADYVNEIEDAIQNSFYKSLKSWKPDKYPENVKNWFFIVARNDILNQMKKKVHSDIECERFACGSDEEINEDLRLKMILFLAKSEMGSSKAKVIFILKNIFGLHTKEISNCTLLKEDAVYKSITRTKKGFLKASSSLNFDLVFETVSDSDLRLVEDIFYSIFNIGYDSFNEKIESIIDEDLCLEALSLTKMLWDKYRRNSTRNLLALFCFHLARIPEKVKESKLIPFFEQDKTKWNLELFNMGLYYLEKPEIFDKYYIEGLIISKHMMEEGYGLKHWNEIVQLYSLMLTYSDSPIMKLNLCYCLFRAERLAECFELLNTIKKELPSEHVYLTLVESHISNNFHGKSRQVHHILRNMKQKIRKEYILENIL